MNVIKERLIKFVVKKWVLGWIADGFKKADGWKTYIAGGISLVLFVSRLAGWVPPEIADQFDLVLATFLGMTGIAGGDHIKKWKDWVEKQFDSR